jgi:ubiquinone/menaquinone biosynthesis C-methylase UbiE
MQRSLLLFLFCAVGPFFGGDRLLLAQAAATAEPQADVISPGPTHYLGREIATTMHYLGAPWLVRESRQREEDCEQLLRELDIRPGMTVCDLGCGNGFYTLRLAELSGASGKVYAVDIQPEMLDMLRERAKAAGLDNIVPVLGTAISPRLPPASQDLVLLVDVYHEFSHPAAMLKAIRQSLKPGGRVALVEFRAEDPEVPIKPLHKMSKRQMLKELRANGFELVRQYDELPWQHLMFFEHRSSAGRKPARSAPLPEAADDEAAAPMPVR